MSTWRTLARDGASPAHSPVREAVIAPRWRTFADRGDRLGRSLADALGRHLVSSARRTRDRIRRLVVACSILPIETTASPHALVAAAIAASSSLVPQPAGPLGAAAIDRISSRAVRALAFDRARRTRDRSLGRSLHPLPSIRPDTMLVLPAKHARHATLAHHARAFAFDSIPIAGALLHLARAADGAIDAWATVVLADLRARRECCASASATIFRLPALPPLSEVLAPAA